MEEKKLNAQEVEEFELEEVTGGLNNGESTPLKPAKKCSRCGKEITLKYYKVDGQIVCPKCYGFGRKPEI